MEPNGNTSEPDEGGFLVLSRFTGEDVVIGPDITVRIAEVCLDNLNRGPRVKLAIRAPRTLRILRGEILKGRTPCRK